MYQIAVTSIFAFVILNFIIVLGFTIGPASLCPNGNTTATCTDGESFEWDTISEMITREPRVRNGFAGFLFLSAFFIFCVVSLILSRLNFYYRELDEILEAAQSSETFAEFKEALTENVLGVKICTKLSGPMKSKENSFYFSNPERFYKQSKLEMVAELKKMRKNSNLSIFHSMSFFEEKQKCVWFVFAGAMLAYCGMGIWDTQKYNYTHTHLAKSAFTMLVILCFLLNHLSWSHMFRNVVGQTIAFLSICGCIVAGVGYVLSSLFWWEYVLVAFLHLNMLSMTTFCVKLSFGDSRKPVMFWSAYKTKQNCS